MIVPFSALRETRRRKKGPPMANQKFNDDHDDRKASHSAGPYYNTASCGHGLDGEDLIDSFDFGHGLSLAFEQEEDTETQCLPINHGVSWPPSGVGATNTYRTTSHEHGAHHTWADHWSEKVDQSDEKGTRSRLLQDPTRTSTGQSSYYGHNHQTHGNIVDTPDTNNAYIQPNQFNTAAGTNHNLFQDERLLGSSSLGLASSSRASYNDERLYTSSYQSMGRDLADYRELDRGGQSYLREPHFETTCRPSWNSYEPGVAVGVAKGFGTARDAEMKDMKGNSESRRSFEVASTRYGDSSFPCDTRIDEGSDLLEPLPLHPEDSNDAGVSFEPLNAQAHTPSYLGPADLSTLKQPPTNRQSPSIDTEASGYPMHPPPPPATKIPKKHQLHQVDEEDIDDSDVLLGRGGKTNHHPGNAKYLQLIQEREVEYMLLGSRNEKTVYAMGFVQQLREQGIRFLKRDEKDKKLWNDVGDDKMREKVSQNLRERQPQLRKNIECPSDNKWNQGRRKRRKRGSNARTEEGEPQTIPPSTSQVSEQPQSLNETEESQPTNWESV